MTRWERWLIGVVAMVVVALVSDTVYESTGGILVAAFTAQLVATYAALLFIRSDRIRPDKPD